LAGPLPRPRFSWKYLYALIVLPLIGIIIFVTVRPILVLPRIRLAPGYLFINQAGQTISHESLRGKMVVYFAGGLTCERCTDYVGLMESVQAALPSLESPYPIQLVTLSVDPAETPQRLADSVAEAGIDTQNWHFLTGDPSQMKYVVGDGFRTYYTTQEDGSLYVEPSIMLVDGMGILRAEYRGSLPSLETVMQGLDLLVTEAENSEGLTRYAYEAAHLFLCYP
jgi:protein SCO1/2